jgi:hypothetical protein
MFVEAGLKPSGGGSNCGPNWGWADNMPAIRIAAAVKKVVFMDCGG